MSNNKCNHTPITKMQKHY